MSSDLAPDAQFDPGAGPGGPLSEYEGPNSTAALDFLVISAQSLSFIAVILTILARRTAKTN